MTRTSIVFASMLKPVDDVRTCHKLARSLVPLHKYDIFIIGYPSKQPVIDPDIKFLPLPPYRRLSLQRAQVRQKLYGMINELKPDILIINTHELLRVAAKLKKSTGNTRIIYDIRENYFDNLGTSELPFRNVLARSVREKEERLAQVCDHFLLAEACYSDLPFIGDRYTVLQNKSIASAKERTISPNLKNLVFTGTLAKDTGVFKAIEIAGQLHKKDPEITLSICGNSFDRKVLEQLKSYSYPWLSLSVSEAPLPYSSILDTIKQADAAIMYYANRNEINRKMPTKLFEYMAHRLPVICPPDSPWLKFMGTYPAALVWNNDPEGLLDAYSNTDFFLKEPGDEVMWKEEAQVFRDLIQFLREPQ